MYKAKLFIYNYGISEVANFKAPYDAMKCAEAFNSALILQHGGLPEKIFYYVQYKKKGKTVTTVDFNSVGVYTGQSSEAYYNIWSARLKFITDLQATETTNK